jgi:hypothetical protein
MGTTCAMRSSHAVEGPEEFSATGFSPAEVAPTQVHLSSGGIDRNVSTREGFSDFPLHPQPLSTLLEISSKETSDEKGPWNLP